MPAAGVTSTSLVRCGATLWIVAAVGYVALEAVAAAAYVPAHSYTADFISDLGVPRRGAEGSPLAALMNTAFVLQGALFLGGAVLVSRGLRGSRAVVAIAAVHAVGLVLVAVVHSGPPEHAGGPSWAHPLGAGLAIVGGNAAILAGSALARRAGLPAWHVTASVVVGVLGLLCLVMLLVDPRTDAVDVLPAGAWERGSVYPITAWEFVTAVILLARSRSR